MLEQKKLARISRRADQSLRAEVLREWYGCDPVLDLNHRVFRADQFVDAILQRAGLNEGIDAESLRQVWSKVAGDYVARHSRPVSVLRGQLTLQVSQPTMRFHLEQMRGELLSKVNQQLPHLKVVALRFALG